MSEKALKSVRQRLRIELDAPFDVIDVVTRPVDYNLWTTTSARHKWPQPDQQSSAAVTFLTFLGWAAARRTGATDLPWEKFFDAVVDIAELEIEEVGPTPPAP